MREERIAVLRKLKALRKEVVTIIDDDTSGKEDYTLPAVSNYLMHAIEKTRASITDISLEDYYL